MESYCVNVQTGYSDEIAEYPNLWINEQNLYEYPLVAAHQKILKEYEK